LAEPPVLVLVVGLAVIGWLTKLGLDVKTEGCWGDIVKEAIDAVGAGGEDRQSFSGLNPIELGLELGRGIRSRVS